jgi:hypothetical protein
MIRIARDDSIPEHAESVELRRGALVAGWAAALLGVGGGLWLVGSRVEAVGELAGPLLVLFGGAALFSVVRLRVYELTVGTSRIDVRCGPMKRTLARGAVTAVNARPARGWRRLYSALEVELRLETREGGAVVPSQEPDAIVGLLRSNDAGDDPR